MVAPLCLGAVLLAALLARQGSEELLGRLAALALGLLGLVCVGWVLVSVFFPARPERTCPSCGAEALERLSKTETRGLRCRACDHQDASASAFLLAEAEGPLEPLVLRERARRGR